MNFAVFIIFAVFQTTLTLGRPSGAQDQKIDTTKSPNALPENEIIDMPKSDEGTLKETSDSEDDVTGDIKIANSPEDYFIGFLVRTLAKKVVKNEVGKLGIAIRNELEDKIDNKIKNLESDLDDQRYASDINESTGNNKISVDVEDSYDYEDVTLSDNLDGIRDIITSQFLPFFHPSVTVTIVDAKIKNTSHIIQVPMSADMTVLESLIAAARAHIEEHGRQIDIPYNVIIDWSERSNCFLIVKALETSSRKRGHWTLTIQDNFDNVVYKGRCLPEDELILRPFWTVTIAYERLRKHRLNRKKE